MYQPTKMNTQGFEIVRNVISVADAEKHARDALDEMETREHMSHSDTIWSLRTHPSVLALFRRLWNTDDIVTGFDGIGVSRGEFVLPWHVDQERHSDTCIGIQGIMALSRHDASSGGLSLLAGSHLEHSRVVDTGSTELWEYQEVDVMRYVSSTDVVTPILSPGDMCLWDSRTCHRVRQASGSKPMRITAYISFEPRSHISDTVAASRRRALREGVSTTHWASRMVDRGEARSAPTVVTDTMRRIV